MLAAGGCVVRLVGLYHANRCVCVCVVVVVVCGGGGGRDSVEGGWDSRLGGGSQSLLAPPPLPCLRCPPAHTLTVPHRGAHTFFLRQGDVPRWGGYTVNLIHYEDAAALCLAVLQGTGAGTPEGGGGAQHHRSRTFLGCDGAPVTFEVGGVGHACGSAG